MKAGDGACAARPGPAGTAEPPQSHRRGNRGLQHEPGLAAVERG